MKAALYAVARESWRMWSAPILTGGAAEKAELQKSHAGTYAACFSIAKRAMTLNEEKGSVGRQ